MYQGWTQSLVSSYASGTLFNTYTTAKTVLPAGSIYTLPQNFLQLGSIIDITVAGAISNIVTTPGTLTLQVMFGAVIAFTTGAIQLNATAHTTLPFWLDIKLTCRSVGNGTAATMMGQGMITSKTITATAAQTDSAQDMPTLLVPATAPAVGTGFDSTSAIAIDFFAGFSINAGGNGIQIHQYDVCSKN